MASANPPKPEQPLMCMLQSISSYSMPESHGCRLTHISVAQMMMITQYFDMLKDIGVSSRSSSVFLPHTPGMALSRPVDEVCISFGNPVLQLVDVCRLLGSAALWLFMPSTCCVWLTSYVQGRSTTSLPRSAMDSCRPRLAGTEPAMYSTAA